MRALAGVLIGGAIGLASFACGSDTDPAPDSSTEGVQGEAGLCADVTLLAKR